MDDQPNELDLNQAANRISVALGCSLEHAKISLETLVVSDRIMIIEVFDSDRKEFRYNVLLAHYRKVGSSKVECYNDLFPPSLQKLSASTIRITMSLENADERAIELRPIEHLYHVRWSEVLAELNSITASNGGISTSAKNAGRKAKDTREQCVAELAGYYSNTAWPARGEDVLEHIREWHVNFGISEEDEDFPSLTTQKTWASRIKKRCSELKGDASRGKKADQGHGQN